MSQVVLSPGEAFGLVPEFQADEQRYIRWYHDLDSWTEYWDLYHPESNGRYYFGDGKNEAGLLNYFLPRESYPPPWVTWTQMALGVGSESDFRDAIRKPEVASGILEIDALVGRLFRAHFGDAADPGVQVDYLEASFRFAIDILPPATERASRIPDDDWRKRTAGRYALDGDLMWFAWALQLEAAESLGRSDESDTARRALLLAGVAIGCPANFAWRGHRRTRIEYHPDVETRKILHERGTRWATDLPGAATELHALYRIREWGDKSC